MKKIIFIIISFITICIILIGFQIRIERKIFYNCTESRKKGYYNIPKDSPYYRKSLDKNNNGIACEVQEGQL